MILIIDGHGDESLETFNFNRARGLEVTLYSYTKAGISVQGVSSAAKIKTAVGGSIPKGYVEIVKSSAASEKMGSKKVKDRILTALKSGDGPFNEFPADFEDKSNENYRIYAKGDGSIIYFALALDSTFSLNLSDVLGFYNVKMDVIWAPCRGRGGAAAARYKKLDELFQQDAAKYTALFEKAYDGQ
jgi:hypothetical protein